MKREENFDIERGERSKDFRRKYLKEYQTDIQKATGKSQAVISMVEKGQMPPFEILDYYYKKGINLNWLFYGDGKMLRQNFQESDDFVNRYVKENGESVSNSQIQIFKFYKEIKKTIQFFTTSLSQQTNDENYLQTLESITKKQLEVIYEDFKK